MHSLSLEADEVIDYTKEDFAKVYRDQPRFSAIVDLVGGDTELKSYDLLTEDGTYAHIRYETSFFWPTTTVQEGCPRSTKAPIVKPLLIAGFVGVMEWKWVEWADMPKRGCAMAHPLERQWQSDKLTLYDLFFFSHDWQSIAAVQCYSYAISQPFANAFQKSSIQSCKLSHDPAGTTGLTRHELRQARTGLEGNTHSQLQSKAAKTFRLLLISLRKASWK